MSAVTSLKYRSLTITSEVTKRTIDLTNSIVFCDYYEDILSPSVMMTIQCAATYSIYNGLPIRGGERVDVDIQTASGDFKLDGQYSMYVYKVSGITSDGAKEFFTLHLCSIPNAT